MAARTRQLRKQGQDKDGQAAGRHAVAEQRPPLLAELGGEDVLVLKARAEPEGNPDHHAFPIVESVLHDDLHTLDEKHTHQHHDIGGNHRAGNGEDQGGHLGQKGESDEDETEADPDIARRHAGQFGERDTARIGRIRHGTGQPGQQIAQTIGVHRTLNRPEINRSGGAP